MHDLNGDDHGGCREVFEGAAFGDAYSLDVETFSLHRAEQLLDAQACAIRAGNLFVSVRVVTACVVSRRQCAGETPGGGSTSRASTSVSVMFAGNLAASPGTLRSGRLIVTWRAYSASSTLRVGRPGAAGSLTVSRPNSGRPFVLVNRRVPSARVRSWPPRISNSTGPFQIIESEIRPQHKRASQRGLTVQCELDENSYATGIKVTDAEMATLNIETDPGIPSGTGKRGKNVGAAAFFSCSGSTRYDS
jgi:hypothetical protein